MPKKVLIVDDSMVIQQKIKKQVSRHSVETLVASNGEEGYEVFKSNPDICLVLSDVNMPKKGGLEMIEEIQSELHPKNTKFALISSVGKGSERQVAKSRELGIEYWFAKPLNDDQVRVLIEKLVI